jgi:hypothetical protein
MPLKLSKIMLIQAVDPRTQLLPTARQPSGWPRLILVSPAISTMFTLPTAVPSRPVLSTTQTVRPLIQPKLRLFQMLLV